MADPTRFQAKLDRKLHRTLSESTLATEVAETPQLAHSPHRFDTEQQLADHLCEGSLLNVGVVASRALSIPHGEYMVWFTDSGRTVLLPTAHDPDGLHRQAEHNGYELHTTALLRNWNRLSRTLQEEQGAPDQSQDHFTDAPDFQPDGPYTFGSKVSRTSLWQAMQDRGIGVQQLADMVGVDKSTISRLLRKVQAGKQGDPGGRNPSVELATKVAKSLGVPVNLVMPPEDELLRNDRVGTSGSGKGINNKAGQKGNPAFSQGNSGGSANEGVEPYLPPVYADAERELLAGPDAAAYLDLKRKLQQAQQQFKRTRSSADQYHAAKLGNQLSGMLQRVRMRSAPPAQYPTPDADGLY